MSEWEWERNGGQINFESTFLFLCEIKNCRIGVRKATGGQQYGMQTTHGTRRSCTCPVGCPEYVSSISRAVRCCTLLLLARARVGKHGHSGPRPVRQCRTSTIRMRVAPGHAESVWVMSCSVMRWTAQLARLTFAQAGLVLSGLQPPSGPSAGGTSVTIRGSGFGLSPWLMCPAAYAMLLLHVCKCLSP